MGPRPARPRSGVSRCTRTWTPGSGEQVVEPDPLAAAGDRGVGQAITGAGPAAQAWRLLHRQRTAAIAHPELRQHPDGFGHEAPTAHEQGHGRGGERRHHAAQERGEQPTGRFRPEDEVRQRQDPTGQRGVAPPRRSRAAAALEPPARANASFQPRFMASWMPVFMPWAPAGECAWAASPARNNRPWRKRPASRCWRGTRADQARWPMRASKPAASSSPCSSAAGTGGPGLPERQRITAGRAGGQQPPGRPLPNGEEEQESAAPGDDMGDAGLEVTLQLQVGQHDLLGVGAATPLDARPGADGAGRAVAARDVSTGRLLDPLRRAQGDAHLVPGRRSFGQLDQLGAPFHRHTPIGEGPRQDALHVHLSHDREVGEGGVGQSELGQPDAGDAGAEMQDTAGRRVRPGQDLLGDAAGAKDLQRPRVHDQGAGRPWRLGSTFDDPDPGAVIMGLQGQGQARRPRPDDEHVRWWRHAASTRRHHSDAVGAPRVSSTWGSASRTSRRRPGRTM